MFTRKVELVIDRPPAEVFPFIADARNRPRWDDSVDSEELTSPEPIGVGSTVRTKLTSMGREYEYTWEITEHQPPTRQRIESTSGAFSTSLAYDLEPSNSGTRLRFEITGRPGGALRLMQPLIARNTQKNLDAAFPRLKQLLES
jgi:carbon monoxide dehydrogenase subunit G